MLQKDKFPPPPKGKEGWPLTTESSSLPGTMADGSLWPRVSVVTPSYNQGQFIEETIRSVLLQGYPSLEYIIIDGGSTDNSVEIIRKYEPWLTYWVSEKDKGQSHAINKGWAKATGDILAWLNSDDLYLPGAIGRAVEALNRNIESAMVYTDGVWIDENREFLKLQPSGNLNARLLLRGKNQFGIPQPSAFMRRTAVELVGPLDESLHMAMDSDLWLRLSLHFQFHYLNGPPLAALRFHNDMKTINRSLEDRLCNLRILDKILTDSCCPEDISKKDTAYARYLFDVALINFWDKRDIKTFYNYFLSALKTNPYTIINLLCNRSIKNIYQYIVPEKIKYIIRQQLKRMDNLQK